MTPSVEEDRSLCVKGQLGLRREVMSQKTKKEKKEKGIILFWCFETSWPLNLNCG